MDTQFCQYHLLILISVEKIVLSLSFGILVKNHFTTYKGLLSILFHWSIYIFYANTTPPDYCCLVVWFEISTYEASNFVLFQDCLAIQGPWGFLVDFRGVFFFPIFYKKFHYDFDRDCIESVDHFGQYVYFNNGNS